MKGYVYFDVEATSADPSSAEILQIAALAEDRAPFVAYLLAEKVDPSAEVWDLLPFDYEAWRERARPPEAVLREFLEYVGDRPLAGHNVIGFDLPLLQRVLREHGLGQVGARALDTQRLAQLIYPTPPDERFRGYGLGDLHAYFTGAEPANAHDALADVRSAVLVAEELAKAAERVPEPVRALWAALDLEEAKFLGLELSSEEEIAKKLWSVLSHEARVPWIFQEGETFPKVWKQPEAHPGLLGEVRGPQLQMMEEVATTLGRSGEASLIEAPTGTGKTRGYLFPILWAASGGIQSDRPYIVATHTKLLQEQALNELERISKMGYQVSAVNLKTPRDYLCLDALREAFEERAHLGDDARAMVAVLLHFAHGGGYDLESLPAYWRGRPGFREVRYRVETNPRRCGQGPEHRYCAHTLVQERKRRARIWVTNQAWLLAHFGQGEREGDPQEVDDDSQICCQLVVDEAHNLEGQATASFSMAVSGEELAYRIRQLYDPSRKTGMFRDRARIGELLKDEPRDDLLRFAEAFRKDIAGRLLDRLERLGENLEWFIKQHGRGDPRYEIRLDLAPEIRSRQDWGRLNLERDFKEFRASLKELREKLRAVVPRHSRLDFRLDPLYDVLDRFITLGGWFLKAVSGSLDERKWVLELVLSEDVWSLLAQPVDLTPHLAPLWRKTNGAVLTSATLNLGDEFGYIRRVLGLNEGGPLAKVRTRSLEGTLPYHRAHLFVPGHLPEARSGLQKRFLRLFEEEIVEVLRHAHRSLTLFTSTERLKEVGGRVKERVERVFLPLTRKEREDVLRRMREDPNAPGHALGSRAFMEGADLPHLKLVNLERIPFPVPNRLLEARGQLLEEAGLDPWRHGYLPKAVLSFVQAFGRLIRDDRNVAGDGAFILWDKRLINAFYQGHFLDALPKGVQLHFPRTRAAFYDELAAVLGVDRGLLPREELLDKSLRRLKAIREGEGSVLEKAFELARAFWEGVDLEKEAEREAKQREAIAAAFAGENLFVFLPTGYGKSLTFQLPAFVEGGLTVVISPLKALMADQVNKLQDKGLPAARVDSSMVAAERAAVYEEARDGRVYLLYLSPERVVRDQEARRLFEEARTRGFLRRVVFDEAHSVWEWGHDFRPDYLKAVEVVREQLAPETPITALTATATPELRENLYRIFRLDPGSVRVVEAFPDRPEIEYYVRKAKGANAPIRKLSELAQLLGYLQDLHGKDEGGWSAIVYVATRKMAERLAWALGRLGFRAEAYHAGLSDLNRGEVQQRFEDGETPIVVATKAFGMGIDKANVRAVVHFEPPESLEAYLQESGRAGRDGLPAHALLCHSAEDWRLLRYMARRWSYDESHVDALIEVLDAGGFWGYPEELLKEVNHLANDGRAEGDRWEVGLDELELILQRASGFGVLRYEYRPGKVAFLPGEGKWTAPSGLVAREGDRHLLDLARLGSGEEAERFARELYRRWRAGELKLLRFYQAAIEVELLDRRGKIRLRNWLRNYVRRAEERVEKVKAYAEYGGCLREYLLGFLGADPSRCSSCSYADDAPPWQDGALDLPMEVIENAYRPEEALLGLFQWMEETWNSFGYEREFSGYGGAMITNVLLGRQFFWTGEGHRSVPSWLTRSPFFGRLVFVRPKEIEGLLQTLSERGFLEKRPYGSGATYRITDRGRARLKRLKQLGMEAGA